MKTKVARRLVISAESGVFVPLSQLRKAALMVGRPVKVYVSAGDVLYHPKGMKGQFYNVSQHHPYRRSVVERRELLRWRKEQIPVDYISQIKTKPGDLILDVHAGSDIKSSCRLATAYSKQWGAKLKFDFCGTKLVASPICGENELYAKWKAKQDYDRIQYLNSEEYKQQEIKEKALNNKRQELIEILVAVAPLLVKDEAKLLDWVCDLSEHGDYIGISWPKEDVARLLEDAGWVPDAHCLPEDASDLEKALFRDKFDHNKTMQAEYIVGQAISCLQSGFAPHQVTHKFVDDYNGVTPEEPEDEDWPSYDPYSVLDEPYEEVEEVETDENPEPDYYESSLQSTLAGIEKWKVLKV